MLTAPKKNLITGTKWAVLMRFATRLTGLVSMLILVRLLLPEDFGIHGMAFAALALLMTVTETGIGTYIIRLTKTVDNDTLNTAWTLQVLQGLLLTVILLFSAPLIASFYNEDRLTAVIWVLAGYALVQGFENIGPYLLRKELKFNEDFKFEVYTKLLTLPVIIFLALYLKNYWALVLGSGARVIIKLILSYQFHPFRPRFSLGQTKSLLNFSLYTALLSLSDYLNRQLSILMIGRMTNMNQVGLFNSTQEICHMIIGEISDSINRPALPILAQVKQDHETLQSVYLYKLNVAITLSAGLGFGLSAMAMETTLIIFGSATHWQPTIMFFSWLAISVFFANLLNLLRETILLATGHERNALSLSLLQVTCLGIACYIGLMLAGAIGVAKALVIYPLFLIPIFIYHLTYKLQFSWLKLTNTIIRPCLSGVIMWVALYLLTALVSYLPIEIIIPIKILSGASIFTVATLLLWLLSGRPTGIESLLLNKIRREKSS